MMQIIKKGRFFVLMCMLLGCLAIQAADDLITQQITIKLELAGSLSSKMTNSKAYKITNLKVVGKIDADDLTFLQTLARSRNGGNLAFLDLSEAQVVSGGYFYDSGGLRIAGSANCLGNGIFYECNTLVSLKLPKNLKTIAYRALSCSNLKDVWIPASVNYISRYAFDLAYSLDTVFIEDLKSWFEIDFGEENSNPLYYAKHLLLNGEELKGTLFIPEGVQKIKQYAFSKNSNFTKVYLPKTLEEIDGKAFWYAGNIQEVIMAENVKNIGYAAFWNCSFLKSVTIPTSSSLIIDGDAFLGCEKLEAVNIFDINAWFNIGFWSVMANPLYYAHHLYINGKEVEYLQVPNGIESIHPNAFVNAKNVVAVVIPNSVEVIGKNAFWGCEKLKEIIIPASVKEIGVSAFQNCSSLQSIYVPWDKPLKYDKYFEGVNKQKCTLYVPKGTYQKYWLSSGWGDFENIVEYDVTGIDKVTTSTESKELSRYSVNGLRLSAPTKGLNIVKYSDGSVKKVAVQ